MPRLHYHRIDVFTDHAFGGNPLAVFTEPGELPAAVMQRIAREFNLSETTFVLPPEDPGNDYRVRIFTPRIEIPMAGHPTLGTAFALALEGRIKARGERALVRFEEGVGPIPVAIEFAAGAPTGASMQQPLPRFTPAPFDRQAVAELLSLDVTALDPALPIEIASCGMPFLLVPLRNLRAIREIRFVSDRARALSDATTTGVFAFTRECESAAASVHARMFAPGAGVPEDPATGSAAGPLGGYLVRHGVAESPFVVEQGLEIERPSRLRVQIEGSADAISGVHVSGDCVALGRGFIDFPDDDEVQSAKAKL